MKGIIEKIHFERTIHSLGMNLNCIWDLQPFDGYAEACLDVGSYTVKVIVEGIKSKNEPLLIDFSNYKRSVDL